MFCGWRFGSCHSFGVVVGLQGYGMCQMRGTFGGELILKMRRIGRINFSPSDVFNFFKVQVVLKPFTCPLGKIFVIRVSPVR